MADDPRLGPIPDQQGRHPRSGFMAPPGRPDTEQLRRQVLRHLDQVCRAAGSGRHLSVVGHRRDATDVLAQGTGDPHDLILGFTLPRRFSAISAYAASVVSLADGRHHDAVVAVAVSRDGTTLSWLAGTGSESIETHRPAGWLVDACRRSVDLATSAEVPHPLELPVALWLDRLMTMLVRSITPLVWADVVRLCPVPRRWQSDDPQNLGSTLGSTTPGWASIRRAAMAAEPLPVAMQADWAAWMDDAMFARWCVGAFPDLDDLRNDVEFMAPEALTERIDWTIAAAWSTFAG